MKACKAGARAGTDNKVTAGNVRIYTRITPVSIPQMDAANLA
jgi:hypothetical protein